MSLVPFKLPGDIPVLVELIPPSFQYPENDEWSMQAEDVESFVDMMNGIRRIWPLIRVAQLLSPPLRDVMRGFVWEENGKPVGLTNVLRQGATDRWYIGNVAVLPEYRRRGIARKLVEACIDLARSRDAQAITLDVVAGNVPAYTLYERLGFAHFASEVDLSYEVDGQPVDVLPLPEGYTVEVRPMFDWRARYELAQRITPDAVRTYTPVDEKLFRQPAVIRVLMPAIRWATGTQIQTFTVRREGRVVAAAMCSMRKRKGGTNNMLMSLDPAHGELAPVLVHLLLKEIEKNSPGRRIEFAVPDWQGATIQAALEAGFTRRLEHHTMGMLL